MRLKRMCFNVAFLLWCQSNLIIIELNRVLPFNEINKLNFLLHLCKKMKPNVHRYLLLFYIMQQGLHSIVFGLTFVACPRPLTMQLWGTGDEAD